MHACKYINAYAGECMYRSYTEQDVWDYVRHNAAKTLPSSETVNQLAAELADKVTHYEDGGYIKALYKPSFLQPDTGCVYTVHIARVLRHRHWNIGRPCGCWRHTRGTGHG
jgi:hypothetical protein